MSPQDEVPNGHDDVVFTHIDATRFKGDLYHIQNVSALLQSYGGWPARSDHTISIHPEGRPRQVERLVRPYPGTTVENSSIKFSRAPVTSRTYAAL